MKLTPENSDYEDCRPPVCRPHSPLIDALRKEMLAEVDAVAAPQEGPEGARECRKNPSEGPDNQPI